MSIPENLQMAHQDDDAVQPDDQRIIDQGTPGGEPIPAPEEERPGGQDENSSDTQDASSNRESPPAMMRLEEPGVPPDEVGILPEGRGELIQLPMDQGDQETPDRLPADQPEMEAVPVALDGAQ